MWDDARQMNALAFTLAILSMLGLVVAGVAFIVRAPAFAFNEVVVTGPLKRANAAYLEAVIRDDLDGTFFTLDLDRARSTLAQVPWVRDVAIRRQWPDRLEITVDEHDPLARFNEGQFVSKRGDVFSAESRDVLPRFEGPEQRAAEMAERYRSFGDTLRPIGLQLTDVRLSARGGWRLRAEGSGGPLTLDLGRDDPDGRLARFVGAHGRTLGALERAGTKVDAVDLRYRNGFAARVPAFREKVAKPAA
jgi:cell division protein FtsQ